jgi:hypothetical protein
MGRRDKPGDDGLKGDPAEPSAASRALGRNSTNIGFDHVRTLFAGAGLAVAAGLLMGAAMKPDLEADNRPAGPQVIAEGPQAPPSGPFDDRAAYASYGGQIPDYVLGTDWKKLPQAPVTGGRYDDYDRYAAADEAPAAEVGTYTPAVYHADDPSIDGPTAYAEVTAGPDLDEEAQPEATGDTTPAR